VNFDPRITPVRPDLAAKRLEGKVTAARFAEGEEHEVIDAQAPLRERPSPDAPLMTEALLGERVTVYEFDQEGWAWGQLAGDGYVGWLPANALMPPRDAPTHKVVALRTLAFPGPSIKLPPVAMPPLGSRIAVTREQDRFAVSAAGFIPLGHLAPLAQREKDFVAVAERFMGVPYLWGGKTNLGLDCSGLVQVALNACGLPCPRDSDMQETRWAPQSTSRGCGAAIWCSGKAMSRSCATGRMSFTPTRFTWRSPSSRSRPRSPASRRRAVT